MWNSPKQERKPKDGSIKKKDSNKAVTAGTGEKSNEGPSNEGSEDNPKGGDQQQEEKEKKDERPKLDVTKVKRRNTILLSVFACIPASPFCIHFHPLYIPLSIYHRNPLLTDELILCLLLFLFPECRYFQLHNTYLNQKFWIYPSTVEERHVYIYVYMYYHICCRGCFREKRRYLGPN